MIAVLMFSLDAIRKFYARLSRIQPYFERAGPPISGIFIATLLVSLTEPAIPALLQPLLDKGFVGNGLSLWKVPAAIIGLFALRGLAGFLAQYFLAVLSNNAMQKLRTALFAKMQRIRLNELAKTTSSSLSNTIVHEIQNGTTQLVNSLLSILKDSLTLMALLAYLLYLNWQLTLIVFTIIPGVAAIMKYFSKRLGRIARVVQKTTDDLAYVVEENVLAQRMVRLHDAQGLQTARFELLSAALRRLSIKGIMGGSAMTPLTQMLAATALSAVICVALWQNNTGTSISVGGFAAFIMAMLMLVAPIKHLSEAAAPLVRGLAAVERGLDFVDSLVDETSGNLPAPSQKTSTIALRFKNIKLHYKDSSGWALDGVSLDIQTGQKVALVGTSGSGKTSLINLLPRFLEPTDGTIFLNGQAIGDWDLAVLRKQFAYVSQDVVMFNDTLGANVALGDPTPSPILIRQALQAAHLGELVASLPSGIHTMVGHNAAQLSGGQRQRLAIARAIYKNAPILLLDEATSALDNESERAVQQALDELMRGRTTLVVAHRLSTVQSADSIAVMSQGKIVEMGTHETLLTQGGHYARLYQMGLSD
jgi:subfamily B ATP-binding cassette protein MsbA